MALTGQLSSKGAFDRPVDRADDVYCTRPPTIRPESTQSGRLQFAGATMEKA